MKKVTLLLVALSFLATDAFAETWTQLNGPLDPFGAFPQWNKIVLSADGKTAFLSGSYKSNSLTYPLFFFSTNSELTWSPVAFPASIGNVNISADGSKLMIIYATNYVSTNSGVTWDAVTGSRNFIAVASSADVKKMVGIFPGTGGSIYVSTNFGATWKSTMTLGSSSAWYSVASSADGTKLYALANDPGTLIGTIYRSTNSGATWLSTAPSVTKFIDLYGVASSADGKKAAVVGGGFIFTTTNAGASWIRQTQAPSKIYGCVTISADGTKITAVEQSIPPG